MQEIIMFILVNILGLLAILAVTLFPLKFKYSINPGIEKKMGVKLKYSTIWDAAPLGDFLKHTESAMYIVTEHFKHLRGKKLKPLMKYYPNAPALRKINYPVEKFSRQEIVWSYLLIINYIVVFSGTFLLLSFFHPRQYS